MFFEKEDSSPTTKCYTHNYTPLRPGPQIYIIEESGICPPSVSANETSSVETEGADLTPTEPLGHQSLRERRNVKRKDRPIHRKRRTEKIKHRNSPPGH